MNVSNVSPENEKNEKDKKISDLEGRAQGCTKCNLCERRTNVVFGEGNPASPLVIVGEGPGENEDRTGRPFVGRAGQLLDECLKACGMTRRHVFITNVVRCRPTEEEGGRLKNRPPQGNEIETCVKEWLVPTLEVVQPLVILCLGSTPANAIIHKGFKITQERGQFFEGTYSRYAIASLHPAFILRQEGNSYDATRQHLINDIESARKKVIEAKKEPPRTLF
jgi:uracil-DNA glycosylase